MRGERERGGIFLIIFIRYRDLLDRWKLWNERYISIRPHPLTTPTIRAQFDHQRKLMDPSHKLVKNASILCVFCSKAITSDALRQGMEWFHND